MNTVRAAERAQAHARSLKAAILAREGRSRLVLMAAGAVGGRSG